MNVAGPLFDFAETPARAGLRPLEGGRSWHGVRAERLELVSRGDIVSGVLVRRAGLDAKKSDTRPALLLLAHDSGACAESGARATGPGFDPVARWTGEALGAVAIDLPLHGHRASPKFSERLISSVAILARGERLDPNGAVLVEEFLRQATVDAIRTLDAVLALDAFDPKRIGFLGIGLGAWVGASLLAHDARLRAAVLAHGPTAPASAILSGDADAGAGSTDVLTLDLERGQQDWPGLARPFLAARLGF